MKTYTMSLSRYNVILLLIGLLLAFTSCKPGHVLKERSSTTYRLDKKVTDEEDKVVSLIEPYKRNLEAQMGRIIGHSSIDLQKAKPESTLGNFVADVLAEEAQKVFEHKISFATQNYGGLRINELTKGPVSVGKIYELMPFENFLVVLSIKGKDLREFFDRVIEYGGWPVSRELKLTITGKKKYQAKIDGKELLDEEMYYIAMPDYIAEGGDNCWFFKEKERLNTGILVRDALINSISDKQQQGLKIGAEIEGRITIIE